ncbi:cytochrome-c oxidase, cbb3-type subunit III [Alcanivorax sp. ZXX171]|nr:cytochrome-c oxidase, cbb3-type subunit III [Alcanivorax sp. ZXX171]
MSLHWSLWIMFLVVLNLGITLFLFLWGTRVHIPTRDDGTTGHVWAHGTLREGVRKLPGWWYWMSASTFVIGIGYLVLYPGFGAYDGILDWSSRAQLEQAQARNEERLGPLMEQARTQAPSELAGNADAVQIGGRLFQDNCAACHGLDARGRTAIGAPDLLDDHWVHGGDEDTILASIREGRGGVMPAWGFLGYGRVKNLAHYVRSLSGQSHDTAAAAVGREHFSTCAGCHGPDGTGNPAMGAPDLTDDAWMYGGELEQIIASIRDGRQGEMPPWKDRLDEARIRLITAWILSNGPSY